MTDRHQVYTKVLKKLKQMTKVYHQGQIVTLAMMVTGIVISRNAQLSAMSSDIPADAKDKRIEMRLRRWVKDSRVETDAVYMPFTRQLLEALASLPLVLVMDGSQAGRGCMVLRVGVLYKKRALSIAWVVYKGKKGHTTAQRHIQALEKAVPLLPPEIDQTDRAVKSLFRLGLDWVKFALKRNLDFEPIFQLHPIELTVNVR